MLWYKINVKGSAEKGRVLPQQAFDTLRLECTLPNLANIGLHSSTNARFYPFTENDEGSLSIVLARVPSKVFTRETVVDETPIRKATKFCKSNVGKDTSRLHPYSMCETLPTGLFTRYNFDEDLRKFKPRWNKSRNFHCMGLS